MTITPDEKDWTWVLEQRCPECGFDAAEVAVTDLPRLLRETTRSWGEVFDRADLSVRPEPTVWSALEYGCHVRDVHRVMAERARLMLAEDDPGFANWDQDRTAIEERYAEQEPAEVLIGLIEAAADAAGLYASVDGADWDRSGRRSNGARFTVGSLGRYHLHDVVHHLVDVGALPAPGGEPRR